MVSFEQACKIIQEKKKGSYMESAFELSDKYVFAMIPKNIKNPDNCVDPFFSVSKGDGEVKEWNITFDLDAYKKAMKKPLLYKRFVRR